MIDTSWVRTYNNKGIYTDTGTIYNLGHAYFACNSGYNVGIGTTSPAYKLHVGIMFQYYLILLILIIIQGIIQLHIKLNFHLLQVQ